MILTIVIALYLGTELLQLLADVLNLKKLSPAMPDDFKGVYDEERYATSQNYLREKTRLGFWESGISIVVFLAAVGFSWFNGLDVWLRGFGYGSVITGILYLGIITLVLKIIGTPFDLIDTFIIEKKYGFNKTTAKTYITDEIKGIVLTILIGAPLLATILWFFQSTGDQAWLWVWAFMTGFQLFALFVAPVWIMPLFNKFTPLEEGELKEKVEKYAQKEGFKLQGIFTMDGSKRSTKSNAYFTGFGKFKRIVLFDTLIEKHTPDELLVILAHEMGHYKLRHIHKMILVALVSMGITLFLLSMSLNSPVLFDAFGVQTPSVYLGLILFGILYTPLSQLTESLTMAMSRKHEYEADNYAVGTTGLNKDMCAALQKLSVDNLSNLTPHPFKVKLCYSHPPVIERLKNLSSS